MSDFRPRAKSMRLLGAVALVLVAVALHYSPPIVSLDLPTSVALWFVIAVGIGLLLGHSWALLLAAVPWPAGIGVGLITGRYLFLGEAWVEIALLSAGVGFAGIAIGLLGRWGWARLVRAMRDQRWLGPRSPGYNHTYNSR